MHISKAVCELVRCNKSSSIDESEVDDEEKMSQLSQTNGVLLIK